MQHAPNVLLIQARDAGDPMLAHEFDCFLEQTLLPASAFRVLNMAADPVPSDVLAGIDCVMVGGSGDFSFVKSKCDWLESMKDLLKTLVDKRMPTFGSCFGFQGLIACLGGSLRRMDGVGEIGTFAIHLTEEGKQDPIFEGYPDPFMAQLGHNDEAYELPDECINLASSNMTRVQAIRIRNAPIFATQFHPELSKEKNYERFVRYIQNYKYDNETVEEAIERTKKDYVDSIESSMLLQRFLKLELDYEPTTA